MPPFVDASAVLQQALLSAIRAEVLSLRVRFLSVINAFTVIDT